MKLFHKYSSIHPLGFRNESLVEVSFSERLIRWHPVWNLGLPNYFSTKFRLVIFADLIRRTRNMNLSPLTVKMEFESLPREDEFSPGEEYYHDHANHQWVSYVQPQVNAFYTDHLVDNFEYLQQVCCNYWSLQTCHQYHEEEFHKESPSEPKITGQLSGVKRSFKGKWTTR